MQFSAVRIEHINFELLKWHRIHTKVMHADVLEHAATKSHGFIPYSPVQENTLRWQTASPIHACHVKCMPS